MNKVKRRFLKLTEERNALDYLVKAVSFIEETEQSDIAWKWVMIALHGAVYGFAICASRGTDSKNVLREVRYKKNEPPHEELISFNMALQRCEKGAAGKPLVISEDERKALKHLKDTLRNNFEHYRPCHWSIEMHGFPEIALHCLRVIETLATETSMWIHFKQRERNRIRVLATKARRILKKSQLYREMIVASEG